MWDFTNDKEQSFQPVPAGTYLVVCREAELKDTKAMTGKYVKCQFEVLEGAHKGRKIWHQFNVQNANEQAEKIGRGQVKTFLLASNVKPEQLKNITPQNFVGQVCKVTVAIESDSYGEKNKITTFKSESSATQQAPAKTAQTTTTAKATF